MALNYEVKKRVFGFDKTKTEKYVAQLKTLGMVEFGDLCDEVTKVGMAPRGVVKMVLDGLIDTLNMNINKGFSVQLGDFGCFRPGLNAKSQDKEEDVKSDTVYRRKIIFTPGQQFKEMLTRASVTDQWQSQIFCQILLDHTVILVSDAPREVVEALHLIYSNSLSDAFCQAIEILHKPEPSITLIPDGVSVILS